MATTEHDYSTLLELMSARDYLSRFEPHLLMLFGTVQDTRAALQEDTARAEAVAARYGLKPAADGRYPLAIWDLARPAAVRKPAGGGRLTHR